MFVIGYESSEYFLLLFSFDLTQQIAFTIFLTRSSTGSRRFSNHSVFCSSLYVCMFVSLLTTSACVRRSRRSGSALAEPGAGGEGGRAASPADDPYQYRDANDTLTPYNNNTLKLDNDSVLSHASKDDYLRDDHTPHRNNNSHYKDNYETTFDLDGNVETKSICSAKSGGSGHDNRYT